MVCLTADWDTQLCGSGAQGPTLLADPESVVRRGLGEAVRGKGSPKHGCSFCRTQDFLELLWRSVRGCKEQVARPQAPAPAWAGPGAAIKKTECGAWVSPGLAGATSWQEGHVQAPRTAFCLLEGPILNKFIYGLSQQFLNPTFQLMLLCVSWWAFVFIHLFLFYLIPERI